MAGFLMMFVIYEHPTDYPEQFVVRRWRVSAGMVEPEVALWSQSGSLEQARQTVPPDLYRSPRRADDDPCIVETWF